MELAELIPKIGVCKPLRINRNVTIRELNVILVSVKKYAYIFLVFTFVSHMALGQSLLGKLKYTDVQFNHDSSLAVITKKKKMALYDVKNQQFIAKPSKAIIIPSFERNWYILIGKKGINVYEHDAMVYKPASQYNQGIIGFSVKELDEKRILIQDYGFTIWNKDKYGIVELEKVGHQKSGVFNKAHRIWEIEDDYERIYEVNNKLVCRKDDSVWVEEVWADDDFLYDQESYKTHYDIFENMGMGYKKVGENIKDSEAGLKVIYDSKLFAKHGNLAILKEGDKYGAIKFNLFELNDRNYTYLDTATVLKVEQKFVTISLFESCLGYQSQDDSIHIVYNDIEHHEFVTLAAASKEVSVLLKDGMLDHRKTDGEFKRFDDVEYYEVSEEYNFGLKLFDSNQVIVTDYLLETPMPDYDDYGEQMFDENGDFVYEQSGEFNQKSGVFDKGSSSWRLKPAYVRIFPIPNDYFVVEEGISVGTQNGYQPEMVTNFHLLNPDLEIVETRETKGDFCREERFLKLLDGRGDEVKLLISPTLKDYLGKEYAPLHNYSTKDGKMRLISELEDFDKLYEMHEAEFIYRNQEFTHWVTMDSGVWMLHFSDTSFVLNNTSSPLEIHHAKGGECRRVIQISPENDTTVLCKIDDNPACDRDVFPVRLTLTAIGDSMIIVDDVYSHEQEKIDEWGYESFMFTEDYAGSAIWKKDEDENWILATPYYATVKNVKSGFIAKTRRFDGGFTYDEYGEPRYDEFDGSVIIEGLEEERYIWLNSDFEAKSFLDYYDFPLIEDLGFGMKVCTDQGCMLVTYSGIGLTDDVWVDFRIENEHIIGTKMVPYMQDSEEFWEEYEDEFYPVEIVFDIITPEDLKK
ncbi:MAG: hypothetical protein ACI857_001840 [Arenicella sp.]